MYGNIAANKLGSVASAIAALAPILWGHYEQESAVALRLKAPSLSAPRAEHRQQGATLPALAEPYAGGGFVAAAS